LLLPLFLQLAVEGGQAKALDLSPYCAVDLDTGESTCQVVLDGDGRESPGYPSGKQFDLRVELRGRRLYLAPRNGASLAQPPAGSKGCDSAEYSTRKQLLEGLRAGSQLCVRTRESRYAEIRIEKDVAPGAGDLVLTYRRLER
jgi:hypothetical protein